MEHPERCVEEGGLVPTESTVAGVFRRCVMAISSGRLVKRESRRDKEFHFQNWFRDRLGEAGFHFDEGGPEQLPRLPHGRPT